MAIYVHTGSSHPKGFVGLRVYAKIGGVSHQKWLSLKGANDSKILSVWKEAVKLNNTYEDKRIEFRANKPKSKQDILFGTGYEGIRMRICREGKTNNSGGVNYYYRPAFICNWKLSPERQPENKSGMLSREFRINNLGYKKAWEGAVELYVEHKGGDIKEMLRNIPEVTRFFEIQKYNIKRGWDVPDRAIPKEALIAGKL